MSTIESSTLETLLRWVGTPNTIERWLVSTSIWVSTLFAGSLFVGTQTGYRSLGLSTGLFFSSVAFLLLTDQMWRRLEISE